MVFEPPHTLVQEIEKRLVAFFGGVVKSPVLFLPLSEGGQRLIDIKNCIRAFCPQNAQHFLYHKPPTWIEMMTGTDISGISSFYHSILKAWTKVLRVKRVCSEFYVIIREDPLFFNPLIQSSLLGSISINNYSICYHAKIWPDKTGSVEIRRAVENCCCLQPVLPVPRSLSVLRKLVEEVVAALPGFVWQIFCPPLVAPWLDCPMFIIFLINVSARERGRHLTVS